MFIVFISGGVIAHIIEHDYELRGSNVLQLQSTLGVEAIGVANNNYEEYC